MKLNRKLVLILSLVLSLALATGGTLAYLSDTDADVNVMTLGNVHIEQHEFERVVDANGNYTTIDVDGTTSYELKEFTQGKPLYPFVGEVNNGYDPTEVRLGQLGHNSRGGMSVFPAANVQDKFVVVENTGNTDAYVRTIVAFEAGSVAEEDWYKIVNYSAHFTWKETQDWFVTEIDGNNYYCVEFVYNGYQDIQHPNGVLKPGDYTYNSLAQVYMFDTATNEDVEALDGNKNGKFDILVLSQAVQAAGFEDATAALTAGFGEFNETNVKTWFGDVTPVNTVNTAAELQAALDAATDSTTILLGANIEGDVTITQKPGVKITIDGLYHNFDGVLLVDGKSGTYTTAGLTVKNLTFKADTISADACIQLGDGTNATRYTCNVTVENCTFDVPGAVGVKSYTGGDKNLTIKGCTATANAHSLVQAKGIDGILIDNCTVKSVRGMNFNNSINVVIQNSTVDVEKYAVRFGESANSIVEYYTIKNCTVTSANGDGDAAIVFRAGALDAHLTLVNTTITAGTQYQGIENVTIIN